MMSDERFVPTGSQTVGPYFKIGLDYLAERTTVIDAASGEIEIRGRVLDRDGAPVPDAMLEFWSPGIAESSASPAAVEEGLPTGFRRSATDENGKFSVTIAKPEPLAMGDGTFQSPHLLVLVFARGLLRHLITRVYFAGEPGNVTDPVLQAVSAERRNTLIAQLDGHPNKYQWNIVLQGLDETVFFAW
jgi:protocatechuate 3,4-dioxygenase, alpha subunit